MLKQIISLKKEVEKCKQREEVLMNRITSLTSITVPNGDSQNKDDIYLVGSLILKEIKSDDIANGTVKSISGGMVKDIKQDILDLNSTPKVIITQGGGNDLDQENSNVTEVISEYSLALTETKAKFPYTKLVVVGLPPLHKTDEIRTKVKD